MLLETVHGENALSPFASGAEETVKGPGLLVEAGAYTTPGLKRDNQDAHGVRIDQDDDVTHYKGVVACVADGLSTATRGKEASDVSVRQFIDDYFTASSTWSVRDIADRSLSLLNSQFYARSHADSAGGLMMTTFSAAVIKGETLHLLNVGDSGVHLFRDGRLKRLTLEDSLHADEDYVLTAALGGEPMLEISYDQHDLQPDDLILLMTDGVANVSLLPTFEECLAREDLQADLDSLSRTLCERALIAGSKDNLTVVCLRIVRLPQSVFDQAEEETESRHFLDQLEIGQAVDGYEVEHILHTGTRSSVYRVKHRETSEIRVLKAPTQIFEENDGYLQAFVREEWIGQRIGDDRILRTYPVGETRFVYGLAEYVEGETLRQWMHDHPNPSLAEVRKILHELIWAVKAMHRQGVVHRDIKPENLMVMPDGRVKIIDFGSASIAGLEEISASAAAWRGEGSLNYSAPEYIIGDPATPVSDLFSVACVAYEMLTGGLPFKRDLAAYKIPTHVRAWRYIAAKKRREDLPTFVDAALEAALHPDPAHRTSTLTEFEADMQRPGQLASLRSRSTALLEREPRRFWQMICVLELIIILIFSYQLLG